MSVHPQIPKTKECSFTHNSTHPAPVLKPFTLNPQYIDTQTTNFVNWLLLLFLRILMVTLTYESLTFTFLVFFFLYIYKWNK